jgi:hypothetical protein
MQVSPNLGHVYSKLQHSILKYLLQRKLEGHQTDLVTKYIYEKFIIENILFCHCKETRI